MARKPKDEATAPADALESEAGRAWLAGELAKAEREVSHGPGGQGWLHNEAKRPEIEERAAFLRALAEAAGLNA